MSATAYGTDHHEMQMDIDVAAMLGRMNGSLRRALRRFVQHPDVPRLRVRRRSVKVVLSGDGGDEIFGGYDWYRPLLERDMAAHSPLTRGTVTSAARPGSLRPRVLWGTRLSRPPAAPRPRPLTSPRDCVVGMDRATSFDVACYLPGDILTKVDRAAMAHGLETRSPFLDVELAEFVLGLPWQVRFARGPSGLKHLLRQACQDLWPASIR